MKLTLVYHVLYISDDSYPIHPILKRFCTVALLPQTTTIHRTTIRRHNKPLRDASTLRVRRPPLPQDVASVPTLEGVDPVEDHPAVTPRQRSVRTNARPRVPVRHRNNGAIPLAPPEDPAVLHRIPEVVYHLLLWRIRCGYPGLSTRRRERVKKFMPPRRPHGGTEMVVVARRGEGEDPSRSPPLGGLVRMS
jgi:hypothetical protein